MCYESKELPEVSREVQDRMQELDRKEQDNDQCVVCHRPLNNVGKFYVHMSTSWKMIHNQDPRLNTVWEEEESQGIWPVGSTCSKKIGKAYKFKLSK